MNYGIANKQGQVSNDEAARIVSKAWGYGLRTIDTARTYGSSEQSLGEIGVGNWDIVTKLPSIAGISRNDSLERWFNKNLQASLNALRVRNLYGLLVHDPSNFFSEKADELIALMVEAKKTGLIHKIGVSVYTPRQLGDIVSRFPVDLVQLPLNVFDNRFLASGWLTALKAEKIEIHSRSAFLQGLLLLPAKHRPKKFSKWAEIWRAWDNWIYQTKMDPLKVCLTAVLANEEIDRVVLGVDNLNHLRQICETDIQLDCQFPGFNTEMPEKLINPTHWEAL